MSCTTAPITAPGAAEYGVDFTWGVTVLRSRTPVRRAVARAGRGAVYLVAALTMVLAAFLGVAGVGLSNTGTAHADIFGISSAVEDWLCGVVAPDEPWEAVGDGPESWLANHNLARVSEAPGVQLDGKGALTTTPGRPGVPDTMDDLRALPKGQYTLYEVAGLRGLSWWTIPLNLDKSRHCSLWNYVWTQGANLLFTLDKNMLQAVIALKEEASKPQPLAFLYDTSGGVMNNIFVFCFIPVAMLTLLASAIWVGIMSARGKANIRGTFSIMATAMAFFYTLTGGKAGFRQVAEGADSAISFLNATGTNAIFDGLTGNQGVCTLDKTGDQVQRGQRLTSCVLADSLAYRPWEIGQFGSTGAQPIPLPSGWTAATPNAGGKINVGAVIAGHTLPCWVNYESCGDLRSYLIAQHGGVQLDGAPSGEQGELICKLEGLKAGLATASSPDELTSAVSATANCSPMYDVFNALAESNPTAATIYAGQGSVTRVSQAFTALLAILLVGIAVLVVAVISMGWEAMTFAYFLIGPVKNGFALYAGKMKMTKEWLEDLGYSYVLRLAYGLVLAIMIVIIVWMMNSTQNFGMRLFWLAVILMGFWKIIQKIQSKLRPGASSMAPDMARHVTESAQKVGRFGGQHAVRALPGGIGSLKATRERRRAVLNDPSRGPMRRKISAITAPLSYATSGLRGAATGSSAAAQARTGRVNSKALLHAVGGGRGPDRGSPPGRPPNSTGPTTRKAGTANQRTVKAKDAPSSIRVGPARRPIPAPDPAGVPGTGSGASALQVPADTGDLAAKPSVEPTDPPGGDAHVAVKASAESTDRPVAETGPGPAQAPTPAAVEGPSSARYGSRPRVVRPVVAPGAGRPRSAGANPGIQRPRMRSGGSPLGSATAARQTAAATPPTSPATPTAERIDPMPVKPSQPPQSAKNQPSAVVLTKAGTAKSAAAPPAGPARRRPVVPEAPIRPARADPSPPGPEEAVAGPPAPPVPAPPVPAPAAASSVDQASRAVKDPAGKGNSETGVKTRRAKAAPSKGNPATRLATTRNPR